MNLTIDSNVQNIVFNGNPVEHLIYNGVEVWSKVVDIYINYGYKYLTFEFTSSGTWGWRRNTTTTTARSIKYRKNGGSWTTISCDGYSQQSTVSVNEGDIIEVYGERSSYAENNTDRYHYFIGTASYNLYGNIKSLYRGENFSSGTGSMDSNAGFKLFYQCKIQDASNLIFDFTTYSSGACYYMFQNCTSMTAGPIVLGTASSTNCMGYMFYGCNKMITGPKLFSLTLGTSAYQYMFYNCSKLNYIEAYFTTTPSTTYTSNWVYGVASSGTFVKNSAATWNVNGVNGVPSGWTKTTKVYPDAFYLPYGASEVANIVGSSTLTGTIYLSRNGTTWYGKKLSQATYQDAPDFMSGACTPYNTMFTQKGYTVGSGRLMISDFGISGTGTNLYVKVDNGGVPFMLCFMGNNGYSGNRSAVYAYGGKITSLCSPYYYVMDKFEPDTCFVFGKMFASTADPSYTLVIDKTTT